MSGLGNPMDLRPAPHHRDARETEVNAAEQITLKAGTLRYLAIHSLYEAGDMGLTDAELAEATDKYLYSIAPRRVELMKMGWVEASDLRRETDFGKQAVVWRLTAAGRERLSGLEAAA